MQPISIANAADAGIFSRAGTLFFIIALSVYRAQSVGPIHFAESGM
jgi:hypothetical protein